MLKKQENPLSILILLTLNFLFAELLFLGNHLYLNRIDPRILHPIHFQHLLATFTVPFMQLILAQLILYVIFIYLLWYLAVTVAEFFSLRRVRLLGIVLWLVSIMAVITANGYFVSHSFFTDVIQSLFNNKITVFGLRCCFMTCIIILLFVVGLALINLIRNVYQKKCLVRHSVFLSLMLCIIFIDNIPHFFHRTSSPATNQPNIFLIGFDAVRPDYLSFFNPHRTATPHFDAFLKSAVVFTDTYTPLSRTFSSWVNILTSAYPLHNKVRDNMVDLESLTFADTLPKILQSRGYETIYASDDSRFSGINHTPLGFDHAIGPPGNVVDFVFSTLNDFPLSNLVANTWIGHLLFPYNFASHASVFTYDPDQFVSLLEHTIRHRDNKPLFLAVHFNITGWPFYWLNDQQTNQTVGVVGYKNALKQGDLVLGHFFEMLKKNGLLAQAIVVLMSDHGITFPMPEDESVKKSLYQAHPLVTTNPALYMNTSWGYGSYILNLKQNQPFLAFKAFGDYTYLPHLVSGKSMLMDIAPTLLDLLQLPLHPHFEGISLKPYIVNPRLHLSALRPIYLESGYTPDAINNEKVDMNAVLRATITQFEINPHTDVVSMTPMAAAISIHQKQRAILFGDWMLAYFPASQKNKVECVKKNGHCQLVSYPFPSYTILMQLSTGKWTTDLKHPFASTAPLKLLTEKMYRFYGKEMDNYK